MKHFALASTSSRGGGKHRAVALYLCAQRVKSTDICSDSVIHSTININMCVLTAITKLSFYMFMSSCACIISDINTLVLFWLSFEIQNIYSKNVHVVPALGFFAIGLFAVGQFAVRKKKT